MQIGQVLDLRERVQAQRGRAERQAEDGLLVEQRVEDARVSELFEQAFGGP